MIGILKKIKNLFVLNSTIGLTLNYLQQQLTFNEMELLKKNPRYQNPKNLIPFGYKTYSQNEEDGIIREIFNRIGLTNKIFVEFGIGDGLENNTLALLFEGWKGLWIEASKKSVKKIKEGFSNVINKEKLNIINAFVTKNNINDLISSAITEKQIDLLSIDIDSNDIHIFNAISCIEPRVVVIEYNAKFRPPVMFCMEYSEIYHPGRDDRFGASLKYMESVFSKKGYNLVGCSLTGSNAFFVRKDLAADKFPQPYSAENHYEPARYYLFNYPSGHKPSYATLDKSIILSERV